MKMTRKKVWSAVITLLSIALGVIWLAPLIWLVGTALTETTFHMTFLPTTPFTLDNIKYVWNAVPFGQYYLNTIILVVGTFCIQFVTSTLAAYSLAFYRFKGQGLVFLIIFMQIIIPNDVLIIPNFMTLSELGLYDTKLGVMLPFLGSAMAIFLLRQHFKTVPKALGEAAMIDGCNPLQIFFKIVFPILKPTMISTAILETMWVWNDYLLPTLVLDIKKYRTIPMAIQYFRGSYGRVEMGPMMACIMITVLPIIVMYLVCQKYIIDGVIAGAVKG